LSTAHLFILAAGFAAGVLNAIAGGGTFISFPTLVALGRNPIIANATNTVAIWPASLAGVYGFRKDLSLVRRWLLLLVIPSFAGGALGAWLLLRTPTKTFELIVPFLILGATLLLAAQEMITRRLGIVAKAHEETAWPWITFVFIFQFIVGLYGGYFGAGQGILMLAALGLIGLTDMHQMNGLKNLLGLCINGIAAIYFVFSHAVIWSDAFVMAAGSIAGGYAGTRLAHRLGRKFVRGAVIAIGLVMTVTLFVRR